MACLDLDTLFTNIALDKTTNNCTDNLYNGNENPAKISKHYFHDLLNRSTKESFVTFNNKAMRSPLGPALAIIFRRSFENMALGLS